MSVFSSITVATICGLATVLE